MKFLFKEVVAAFQKAIDNAIGPYKEAALANQKAGAQRTKAEGAFRAVIGSARDAKFHYQCNSAMALTRVLKGVEGAPQTGKEIAEAIVAGLEEDSIVDRCEVFARERGPTFINIVLKDNLLVDAARYVLSNASESELPPAPTTLSEEERQRVIVDFSSPNIAKSMHVGHLRSTIIGDSICKVLEFLGHDVERVNHVGDWGTQFGMLITMLFEECGEDLSKPMDISDLVAFYKQAKIRFDEDEDFANRSRNAVVLLQGGDERHMVAWKMLCDVSRSEFQTIYDNLGVVLTEKGESFYNSRIPGVVAELEEMGIAEEDEGAVVIFPEGRPKPTKGKKDRTAPPFIIRKRDGGYGYDSTDMTCLKYRLQECHADRVIYVTDHGQSLHFELLKKCAIKAGWLKQVDGQTSPRFDHVGFGLVLGNDGKRFKTRSGETVKLGDLLDEAVRKARDVVDEKRREDDTRTEEELAACARAIGLGAVKYADLSCQRHKDYVFSYDRMLNLKGDTAVYLLYMFARISQIAAKAEAAGAGEVNAKNIAISHPTERALLLEIARMPDCLENAAEDLMPSHVAEFAYRLCTAFSDFYSNCRVVSDTEDWDMSVTRSRLAIVKATQRCIKLATHILGIETVDRI